MLSPADTVASEIDESARSVDQVFELEVELTIAAMNGDVDKVEHLLRRGADPDGLLGGKARSYQFRNGQPGDRPDVDAFPTPLLACLYPHPKDPVERLALGDQEEIVTLLLEAGADPNMRSRDWFGVFPLLFAAECQNANVVGLLLDSGADVFMTLEDFSQLDPSTDPATALDAAVSSGNLDVLRRLLSAGADPTNGGFVYTPLSRAAYKHDPEVLRLILNHLEDRKRFIEEDLRLATGRLIGAWESLLDYPPVSNHNLDDIQSCFSMLVEFGALADTNDVSVAWNVIEIGNAQLHSWYAAQLSSLESGNRSVFEWLNQYIDKDDLDGLRIALDMGMDVNSTGDDGRTVLHNAVFDNDPQIIRLLLQYGADVHAVDDDGDAPVDWASGEIEEILIAASQGDIDGE